MNEERVLVSLQQLQWGDDQKSPLNSLLFSRQQLATSRTTKSAAVLELKYHISSSVVTNFHEKLLLSDEARVSSLQSQFKPLGSSPNQQQSEARIPLASGVALQTLNYIVTIKMGAEDMSVIVDTGSDLTWVQCKPCTYCYAQHNPLYDPSTSATYTPIPCNSTSCASLTSGNCGLDRNACNYGLRYGDGSYTRGVLAREQIGLGDATVDGFIFGCGRSNRGLFGRASGLVGLGRGQLSLAWQTKAQFGGVFSYCLPSRVYNSSGNLILGNDPSNYKNATSIAYTGMVQGPRPLPFYFLNLTSVRIGGVELGISKGVRVLIDSGTVITRLVPSMYNAVRDEFVKQFSGYPTAIAFSILDTCFDLSKYDQVRVPKLGFGFEGGVDMNVDVTGTLYIVKKDASQVCLAMTSLASEEGVGIIGNYQQKNQRIVYDNEGARVGFGEEKCSYS